MEIFWHPLVKKAKLHQSQNQDLTCLMMLIVDFHGQTCKSLPWEQQTANANHCYPEYPSALEVNAKFLDRDIRRWWSEIPENAVFPPGFKTQSISSIIGESEKNTPIKVYQKICKFVQTDLWLGVFTQCLI